MKKITIIALGTRGDVQPFTALGKGLKSKGFKVIIATTDDFETMVESHGLGFQSVGLNAREIINTDIGISLSESGKNVFKTLNNIGEVLNKSFITITKNILEICKNSDALICSNLSFMGFDIAEKYNIPVFYAILQPMMRTSRMPFAGFPELKINFMKKHYNYLSYLMLEMLMWNFLKKTINKIRTEILELPKTKSLNFFDNFHRQENPIPVICGFSRYLAEKPHDWKPTQYITGFWFLENNTGWQPDQNLLKFIENGSPPLYAGFGSMNGSNPEKFSRTIINAILKTGQRAVISRGWGGIKEITKDKNIFYIDSVPHDWLFPRMKALIHHGGSGTTGSGLKSGTPSIIIPFYGDQNFWADRTEELHIGSKISLKKLTEELLIKKINLVLNEPEIKSKTVHYSKLVTEENGVQNAVGVIERYLKNDIISENEGDLRWLK